MRTSRRPAPGRHPLPGHGLHADSLAISVLLLAPRMSHGATARYPSTRPSPESHWDDGPINDFALAVHRPGLQSVDGMTISLSVADIRGVRRPSMMSAIPTAMNQTQSKMP